MPCTRGGVDPYAPGARIAVFALLRRGGRIGSALVVETVTAFALSATGPRHGDTQLGVRDNGAGPGVATPAGRHGAQHGVARAGCVDRGEGGTAAYEVRQTPTWVASWARIAARRNG